MMNNIKCGYRINYADLKGEIVIALDGRINIHRLSRWFFIFGQLALILPAARKPRL